MDLVRLILGQDEPFLTWARPSGAAGGLVGRVKPALLLKFMIVGFPSTCHPCTWTLIFGCWTCPCGVSRLNEHLTQSVQHSAACCVLNFSLCGRILQENFSVSEIDATTLPSHPPLLQNKAQVEEMVTELVLTETKSGQISNL